MARRIAGVFAFVLCLLVILAIGAGYVGYQRFHEPGPAATEVDVLLTRGSSVAAIAQTLADAGIISDTWIFRIGVRLSKAGHAMQAGEYRFAARVSMRDAMELLRSGATVVRKVTVPEGLTTVEVVALISTTEGLTGDVPHGLAEGTLLPETYHFSYGDDRAELLRRMRMAMANTLDTLWRERDRRVPLIGPSEALILASIVEKETAVAEERSHVAGVFVNRLKRRMPLQSDPTVVYSITNGNRPLGRPLMKSDLNVDSPFNTYANRGLPPAPIANPGRAAIEAVLHPLDTKDLYFVADGSGGHAFASTFAEHRRNVQRWRKLQRRGN